MCTSLQLGQLTLCESSLLCVVVHGAGSCRHYFPWVADQLAPDIMPHANQRRSEDPAQYAPLPTPTADLIREYYRQEVELYEFALSVHRAQVARVLAIRSAGR
jgi:hypothetical protein